MYAMATAVVGWFMYALGYKRGADEISQKLVQHVWAHPDQTMAEFREFYMDED